VEIAFSIIETLQEQNEMGITQLSEEPDYAKSTVHSHLRTLEEQEMIVRGKDGYRLSIRILDMATHVRKQIGNYEMIRDEVEKLAEETGEIAQFGVEEYNRVTYFYKATGNQSVETLSSVGKQQPMHSTALGKTILAFRPPERVEESIADLEMTRRTPETITGPEELQAELETIREQGYGIDNEENIEGLRCVAAPIRTDEGAMCAVSISRPSSRFTEDRLQGELSNYVQRAANVIELNTKFS
jgi:DNA-binding IclR family transcriptional regulator